MPTTPLVEGGTAKAGTGGSKADPNTSLVEGGTGGQWPQLGTQFWSIASEYGDDDGTAPEYTNCAAQRILEQAMARASSLSSEELSYIAAREGW